MAAPHNSGTTFLSALLANYLRPDIPYLHLADGYDGCDHTLSALKLNQAQKADKSYVAPLHVRASPFLADAIAKYDLKPIVLTRNIFDCIASLKDRIYRYKHKTSASSSLVFVHTTEYHSRMSEIQLERYLVTYAVPWYISFYVSWKNSGICHNFVTYENLTSDTEKTLINILEKEGINPEPKRVKESIEETKKTNTRLNVGKKGRGETLAVAYRSQIADMMSHYPDIDFKGLLGI